MQTFTFNTAKTIICQPEATSQIVDLCHQLRVRRPLIVTDSTSIEHNLLTPVIEALNQARIPLCTFTDATTTPTEDAILKALRQASTENIDGIIGIGNHAAMEIAKLVALLAGSGMAITQLYGKESQSGSRLPLIQIPAVAGTGSECSALTMVLTDQATPNKVYSSQMLPDAIILDVTLTQNLPADYLLTTAANALTHCIEAYTSTQHKNLYSDMLAKESLSTLLKQLSRIDSLPLHSEIQQSILLCACTAAQAYANTSGSIVHALAYPLQYHYQLEHGLSNALMLPAVMQFNMKQPQLIKCYETLFSDIEIPSANSDQTPNASYPRIIQEVETAMTQLHIPASLRTLDIKEQDLPMLAESAVFVQRLLLNNVQELNFDAILQIYRAAYQG